jgi:hypothetical protein
MAKSLKLKIRRKWYLEPKEKESDTIRNNYSDTLQLFNIKTAEINKNIRRFLKTNKIKFINNDKGVLLTWDPKWVCCKCTFIEDKNVYLCVLFAYDRTDILQMELSNISSKLLLTRTTDKFTRETENYKMGLLSNDLKFERKEINGDIIDFLIFQNKDSWFVSPISIGSFEEEDSLISEDDAIEMLCDKLKKNSNLRKHISELNRSYLKFLEQVGDETDLENNVDSKIRFYGDDGEIEDHDFKFERKKIEDDIIDFLICNDGGWWRVEPFYYGSIYFEKSQDSGKLAMEKQYEKLKEKPLLCKSLSIVNRAYRKYLKLQNKNGELE